jgi:glycosyltransferase involved in cell wall biosynthesis/GT2 family glycosyltransferase
VVLFTSYSGALGGAERLLIDWATALELEACLACPDGALADAARARGLRVISLHGHSLDLRASPRDRLLSVSRLARHARELRRLVRTLDPELVVAWGMRSGLACLLGPAWSGRLGSSSGRPAIVFHHNDLLPGPVIARLVRSAAARAELVTVPSQAVAEDLDPAGRLGDRLEIVHPGVDLDRFEPASPPAQPPEVVVLGALVPWKRVDLALDACALARRHHPELRLRLVGGPLDNAEDRVIDALRARAAQPDLAGAVEFAGQVPDSAPELARATCLLHCAEREPFGIAVLEALAAGRPAVVPASAGPAEIVDDSCALLYPPGDAVAAGAALTRLLSDPELAARMGAAGRSRAREQFDETDSRRRWAEAVTRVLAAGAEVTARARPSGAASRPAQAAVEIVTVTHNSASVIGGLLASVERHLPGVSVVVVDSASSDETVAIARRFGSARVVALDQNVGFGRACNRGLAEIRAPVTALLNPDVELLDDSLLLLCEEAARRERDERLLAPLVLSDDGSRQDSVHPAPGSPAELGRALLPFTHLPLALAAPLAPWRAHAPRRVGWAVGCALVGRTETLGRLGPFDERIFLYGEDLDLGLRAAEAGIETWFWPSARVLHHGAHATRAAFDGEPFELLASGRRDVVERRLGRRRGAVDDAAQALTFGTRIVAKAALGRPAARERHQLAALRAARGSARVDRRTPR